MRELGSQTSGEKERGLNAPAIVQLLKREGKARPAPTETPEPSPYNCAAIWKSILKVSNIA